MFHVSRCYVVVCWEGTRLLALVCSVFLRFCRFLVLCPGSLRCLVASISDLIVFFTLNHKLSVKCIYGQVKTLMSLYLRTIRSIHLHSHLLYIVHRSNMGCVVLYLSMFSSLKPNQYAGNETIQNYLLTCKY